MIGRASTSSFNYQWTYDVFINFRGEDTRHGFTGNLYHALTQKGVRTFIDDEELEKGDEITPTLLKAIEESRMAITIFSKNYASSTFCLNELDKIVHCIKRKSRLVWPIFYDVEPSDVRYQKGNYEQALAMHVRHSKASQDDIQRWKIILCEVANISGSHFSPRNGQYEYEFVESFVEKISSKVNRVPLYIAKYPVGLESRVQKINSLLQIWSKDEVCMVGICGIGGSGKTTIARAVYNLVADNFEGLCFLHDIKENSRKLGLEQMQGRMLSKIVGVDIKIDDVNEGIPIIKRRLNQKRILLILDNIDKREQLEKLASECSWFGSGSRIIITTRDRQLLLRHGVERIYDMEEFNYKESHELLTWNAFRNKQVDPSYIDVLTRVLHYVQGLPLALEIIGSHLFGMNINEWESALDVYRQIPHEDIQQILKISYDSLKEDEQEIFLDIACFFQGKKFDYVIDMVQLAHGFNPRVGIRVLEEKSLIRSHADQIIGMHGLIQDMGREIIRQESQKEPGKRSRLWLNEEIAHVLEENTGTDEVEIIIQNNSSEYIEVAWDGEAFKNMKNLKILIFEKARFSEGPKYLPNGLKVLKWDGYPSSFLPDAFCPKKLVVFSLPDSSLTSVEQITKMKNLSALNLKGSQYIREIPNLSCIPNLKELRLESCKNLVEIHQSVGSLAKLETLNAKECVQLETFPRTIKLPYLRELCLSGCSNLKYFPEIPEKMECIELLDLAGTGIEKMPFSVCNLTRLKMLTIEDHRKEIELPSSIAMLQGLVGVNVEKCGKLLLFKPNEGQEDVRAMLYSEVLTITLRQCNIADEVLSMYLSWFITLQTLDLRGSNFTILPACIKECYFLEKILLNECKHLREVQGIPPRMRHLKARHCLLLSSESRSLLLNQEFVVAIFRNRHISLIGPERIIFMPGASIPEWFDHCSRGSSICFMFRKEFPQLVVCAVIGPAKDPRSFRDLPYMHHRTLINGKKVRMDWLQDIYSKNDYHIIVYGIQIVERFQDGEWNVVEIRTGSWRSYILAEQSGIYVMNKEHFSMENIQFITGPNDLELSLRPCWDEKENNDLSSRHAIDTDFIQGWGIIKDCYKMQLLNLSHPKYQGWRITKDRYERQLLNPPQKAYQDDMSDEKDMSDSSETDGEPINNDGGYEWLSLHPCWETPLDDHDVTLASLPLPLLTPPSHSMDTTYNQDDMSNKAIIGASTVADEEPCAANRKKEPLLNKKRKLQDEETFASSPTAIPFRCAKRGRNRNGNEEENNSNTTQTQSPNASDDSTTHQVPPTFDAQEKEATSCSDDSKWISLSLCTSHNGINKASHSRYTTNATIRSNQGTSQNNNESNNLDREASKLSNHSKNPCMCGIGNNINNVCKWLSLLPIWEAPLHGSTTHQEVQPRHNIGSMNLEEIPESSSEDVRKAKGKEIIVYKDSINEK